MGSQPTVLVVDDDEATRWLAREALQRAGLAVLEAADGEQAMSVLTAHRPDALLLDLYMPRVDGYQVLSWVSARAPSRATPVMVMTTRGEVESIERAFELGATDFVQKPLVLPLLPHRMRYLLRAAAAFQEVRESERRLSRAQRLARLAHWRVRQGAFEWSTDPLLVFGAAPPAQRAGPAPELLALVHPDDAERVRAAMQRWEAHELDYRVVLPDGSSRLVHQDAEPDPSGPPGSLFGATQDVTESRRAELQSLQLAYYDEVSGLPNREFLRRVLASPAARAGELAAIAIELGVARIRDALGDPEDVVLLAVIERVVRLVGAGPRWPRWPHGDALAAAEVEPERAGGGALVARVGDDELAVIGRWDDAAARALAAALAAALARPLPVDDIEVVIAASLGVSSSRGPVDDLRQLARCAHVAMATSRKLGRATAAVFDRAHAATERRKVQVGRELHRAVARLHDGGEPELRLLYQPKIELGSGQLVGVEALLRWRSPGLGEVGPDEFVPIAEATGVIVPLGDWVLEEACRQGARWLAQGAPLRVAVNVSPRQLRSPDFVARVLRVTSDHGLPPALLELEITEHVTMRDYEHAVAELGELRRLGVQIALDDFGMGYSSLAYLSRLPIDVIKIDRSFILPVGQLPAAEAIPAAILAMARSFGLRVVAEGVETLAQAEFLERHGAAEAQGYLFARPIAPAELERLLGGERRFFGAPAVAPPSGACPSGE